MSDNKDSIWSRIGARVAEAVEPPKPPVPMTPEQQAAAKKDLEDKFRLRD